MKKRIMIILVALAFSLVLVSAGCTGNNQEKEKSTAGEVSAESSSNESKEENNKESKGESMEESKKESSAAEDSSEASKQINKEEISKSVSEVSGEINEESENTEESKAAETSSEDSEVQESIVTKEEVDGNIEALGDPLKNTKIYKNILGKDILINDGEVFSNYRLSEESYIHKIINYNGKIYEYEEDPISDFKKIKVITDDKIYTISFDEFDPEAAENVSKIDSAGEYTKYIAVPHMGYLLYKEILGYDYDSADGDTEKFVLSELDMAIKVKTEDKKVTITELNEDGTDGEVSVYEIRAISDDEKAIIEEAERLIK